MTFLHMTFYSVFALSTLGLAFHWTHLISALLCLESMMYISLSLWPIHMHTTSSPLMPILMLAFSACKAGTDLAILVASTWTCGSDHLHNLNLLQCQKLFSQQSYSSQ